MNNNILLDTNILIRTAKGTLSEKAKRVLRDGGITLYFSTASIWEIAIKSSLNKLNFVVDQLDLYNSLLDDGYRECKITAEHTMYTSSLKKYHKDPFDHLIIAQSIIEELQLVTTDKVFQHYDGDIVIV